MRSVIGGLGSVDGVIIGLELNCIHKNSYIFKKARLRIKTRTTIRHVLDNIRQACFEQHPDMIAYTGFVGGPVSTYFQETPKHYFVFQCT
jgi:hypothetical protein